MNEVRAPTGEQLKEEILEEYYNGGKPKALSEKFGISVNTIKSWIKRDKDKSKAISRGAPASRKGASLKKKKGAPAERHNEKGAGAPIGNKNAVKHGGYSSVYSDALDDEEKELMKEIPDDGAELLMEQISLFYIRERRILKAINKYREKEDNEKGNLVLSGAMTIEQKRKFDSAQHKAKYEEIRNEKIKEGKISYMYRDYNVTTNTEAAINVIQRLERELTSIQAKKTKCIDALIKMQFEERRLQKGNSANETVEDWISAMMEYESLAEDSVGEE